MKSPLSSLDADLRRAGASQPRPPSAAAGCKWAAAVQQCSRFTCRGISWPQEPALAIPGNPLSIVVVRPI